jgi:hypothetical protein
MAYTTGDDNYGVSSYIVDKIPGNGNYLTIASALSAASAASFKGTIFIRPGVYTEDPVLIAGINLCAFNSDGFTGSVAIVGNCTFSGSGNVTLSGLELTTRSGNMITVSGSSISILYVTNCYLNCSNNTGISYTSSNASSSIAIQNCFGNLATTGIALFTHSSAGTLDLYDMQLSNSGNSSTASTCSGTGTLNIAYSAFDCPVSVSSSSIGTFFASTFDTSSTNVTTITVANTAFFYSKACVHNSGSASAFSIGSGSTLVSTFDNLKGTNANMITGAGTIELAGSTFIGAGTTSNATTYVGFNPGPSGSFTPGIAFGGSSTGITYSVQQGDYIRIGNIVYFTLTLTLSGKGSQTGNATITGFPFAQTSTANLNNMPLGQVSSITFTGTPYLYGLASTTTLGLATYTSATGPTNLTNTNFSATSGISTTGFYMVI